MAVHLQRPPDLPPGVQVCRSPDHQIAGSIAVESAVESAMDYHRGLSPQSATVTCALFIKKRRFSAWAPPPGAAPLPPRPPAQRRRQAAGKKKRAIVRPEKLSRYLQENLFDRFACSPICVLTLPKESPLPLLLRHPLSLTNVLLQGHGPRTTETDHKRLAR